MKKEISIAALVFVACLSLTACTSKPTNSNPEANNFELTDCYDECERFGGGGENVKMCEQNCDASFATDSVWNEDDNKYNEDLASTEWPNDMPDIVPMFTYGEVSGAVVGMGSWVVDFKNVSETALDDYTNDLESEDWSAGKIAVSGMIIGTYEGEDNYSINVNIDEYQNTAQIIVKNKKK